MDITYEPAPRSRHGIESTIKPEFNETTEALKKDLSSTLQMCNSIHCHPNQSSIDERGLLTVVYEHGELQVFVPDDDGEYEFVITLTNYNLPTTLNNLTHNDAETIRIRELASKYGAYIYEE